MSEEKLIRPGRPAPDFTLPDQDGEDVSLSDFRGQRVVLYFYPKANTSGCTTQACGIRDARDDFEAAGAVVLGVSPDPVKAVKKFHDAQGLNFTLLADEDRSVCEAYGVWVEKSMYGRKYWGAQRATFVIGEDGVVADVIEKAAPRRTTQTCSPCWARTPPELPTPTSPAPTTRSAPACSGTVR